MEGLEQAPFPEEERPPVLYHGSASPDLDELEPRVSKGSGEAYGSQVYASQDMATASIFMAKMDRTSSAGHFGDVPYALITKPRDEFIAEDKGGYIYVVPGDGFTSDPDRNMGKYEWASSEPVKPQERLDFPSALDAMIDSGVQVYFVDPETFTAIRAAEDHGLAILEGMESENQHRGTNIRFFREEGESEGV